MDSKLTKMISTYLSNQPVERAWIYGSYSRGEETDESDIDLLVVFDEKANVSLLRHAKMIVDLEKILNKRVDMVTDGNLLPFAQKSANKDKILIYERAFC